MTPYATLYELKSNSGKGGYIKDHIGKYVRAVKGDTGKGTSEKEPMLVGLHPKSWDSSWRQRDYLEKSVDSLKRKLEKDSQASHRRGLLGCCQGTLMKLL